MRDVEGACIGEVDCTLHRSLCTSQEVKGFPTLKLYAPGFRKGVEYKGPRDFDALSSYVEKHLGPQCSFKNRKPCSAEENEYLDRVSKFPKTSTENRVAEQVCHLFEPA